VEVSVWWSTVIKMRPVSTLSGKIVSSDFFIYHNNINNMYWRSLEYGYSWKIWNIQ